MLASAVALASIVYVSRSIPETMQGLAAVVESRRFSVVVLGLAILLVFSRIFGMADLWQAVLASDDLREVKSLAEEGTELLAGCLITLGVVGFAREMLVTDTRSARRTQRPLRWPRVHYHH